MEAKEELVLQLFDLYWFKLQILVNQQKEEEKEESSKPEKLPSIHVNKPSNNQFSISKEISYGRTESPNSVLAHSSFDLIISDEESDHPKKKKKRKKEIRRGLRKSLAELEMEELKGFRELGFVLSEESPRLVSILPGLRRLKERDDGAAISGGEEVRAVSRPYLSETWRWNKEKKEEGMVPLMRWRIPSMGSEADMKKSLKMWARTVASAVR